MQLCSPPFAVELSHSSFGLCNLVHGVEHYVFESPKFVLRIQSEVWLFPCANQLRPRGADRFLNYPVCISETPNMGQNSGFALNPLLEKDQSLCKLLPGKPKHPIPGNLPRQVWARSEND